MTGHKHQSRVKCNSYGFQMSQLQEKQEDENVMNADGLDDAGLVPYPMRYWEKEDRLG